MDEKQSKLFDVAISFGPLLASIAISAWVVWYFGPPAGGWW